ncbi:hypothetical protein BDV97DRAFT_372232 [Delphinella strobiligena]|nr:hypothetical protein BDV97DRAFT_372232 [Delphinella strobiligena]
MSGDQNSCLHSVFVHKELLCFYLPYYHVAIKGGFAESGQRTFTIEGTKTTLSALLHWLYSGNICIHSADNDNSTSSSENLTSPQPSVTHVESWMIDEVSSHLTCYTNRALIVSTLEETAGNTGEATRLLRQEEKRDADEEKRPSSILAGTGSSAISSSSDARNISVKLSTDPKALDEVDAVVRLYLLADQTECLALRRTTISYLQILPLPRYSTVTTAVSSLLESSPLRNLLVDSYASHWETDHSAFSDDDGEKLPSKFFYKVLIRKSELRRDDRLARRRAGARCVCCGWDCRWHEHGSNEDMRATCGSLAKND